MFSEIAHAQFVERHAAQRCKYLLLKLITLMRPGITRRANRFVGRFISVGEMVGVRYSHWPMIAWSGSDTGKRPLRTVERVEVALCAVTPGSPYVWHKADAVDPIAIVESIHLDHSMFVSKLSSEFYILIWIALGTPLQFQLEDAPLLDICC